MQQLIKQYKFIIIGFLCGLAAWISDTVIDTAFFSDDSFFTELLQPSIFEMYYRSILLFLFILFGIYAQRTTNRLNKQNDTLIKLSTAIDQADESICITDSIGRIEFANPAFYRITGYSMAETIGQTTSMLKSSMHESAFYQDMWSTINCHKTWRGKIFNRCKDGTEYPAMLTISPIEDETGNITHFISLEQNLEQYEKLQQQFFQAQKMEAIGTLVGGIAHDFNNTLAAITGNLYLVKGITLNQPEVISKLTDIENLSFSAAEMIQHLLAFSRKGVVKIQPLNLASYLKEITKLNRVALPKQVNFSCRFDTKELTINADAHLLHQIILNLINNARDAVEGINEPVIQLELSRVDIDKNSTLMQPMTAIGPYACISLRDNGTGINKEDRNHIFEPFFTTKEVGKGTGLGLSMVYGAMQTHQGFITTEHNDGTCFNLFFPLIEKPDTRELSSDQQSVMAGHAETILLADDNSSILTTTKEILNTLNYNVITAADGTMAIKLFKEHRDNIALVILDVVMPGLSGPETAYEIRSISPATKILFISGYDQQQPIKQNDEILKSETVLAKPFTIALLGKKIREQLAD